MKYNIQYVGPPWCCDISPIGENIKLLESQARPLVALEPEEQRVVWQRVVETAPNGKVTAVHVQNAHHWSSVESPPLWAKVKSWLEKQK